MSGALLVTAYIYSSLGDALVFQGLFLVSVYYGLAIAAICVPVWLILTNLGWARAPAAVRAGR